MKRTQTFWPAACAALLITGFSLLPASASAEDESVTDGRRLDWISPEEIAAMPPEQRPYHTGMCDGVYMSPALGSGDPADSKVFATANQFDTSADGRLVLEGDVKIRQGNRELESDTVRLDRTSRESELSGNVMIRQPGMLIRGDQAKVNMDRKEIDARGTEYVIHSIHAHGTAGRIHNKGEKKLILDESSYTTCEPNDDAWRINAGRIKLDQESGWGEVEDATVEIGGVPIVWLPWWMFPIDDRRQSGFLFPLVGNNSESGVRVGIPYYLNLAPNYDATLTPTLIGERGTMLEGEFRYLTPNTEGFVGGAYLPSDNSYENLDRRMLSWKQNSHYGRMISQVDYTRVSDIDYFEDLDTSLATSATTHLEQRANLNYFGERWGTGAIVQQYQTIDDTIADSDLPYRKLPQLYANGIIPTFHSPLEFTLGTEYIYFEHPEADDPTLLVADNADRARLAGGVRYNFNRSWGYMVPSYSERYRYYNISGGPMDQQEPDLHVPVFNIDSGLYFDRPFEMGDRHFSQTLEPRLYYLYVPYQDQNDLPLFDTSKNSFGYEQLFRDNRFTGGDRIGDANQVSLGVTTRFIDHDTGLEKLNLALGQIFYMRDREVQLHPTDPVETTSFSPYVARAFWTINEAWSWRTETQMDTEVSNLDTLVTGVAYRGKTGNLLNLNYNYYDDGAITADPEVGKIKQTDISFIWAVSRRWSLMGRWGYDIEEDRSFDNIAGVEYESCCWRARLVNRRYLKESNTEPDVLEPIQGIYIQVELKGLGGVGGTVDSILEEGIGGYREREDIRPPKF
ncbi:MAG: LPS-assembly protein LptD [Gammaproteobacteria bacterium]|nr:LPS-assembly protein LptD [Gammaproteobacteria bacterium]